LGAIRVRDGENETSLATTFKKNWVRPPHGISIEKNIFSYRLEKPPTLRVLLVYLNHQAEAFTTGKSVKSIS
jgi:hypothetical protein